MRFSIDTSVIENEGMSMQEFCVVLYYLTGGKGTLNTELCEGLWNRNVLRKTESGFELKPHMTQVIQAMIAISDPEVLGSRDINALADKLRALYPEGKKNGTCYYWRDSTKVIAQRLAIFFKKYSNRFTVDDIIEATRAYVNSFNGDYRYMQLLKYFIYKDDNSQLLSYLENAGQGSDQRDWMDKVI